VAARSKDKVAREARERSRIYQARAQMHEDRARRRTRDNVVASIVGAVIVVLAVAGQFVYYTSGPGAPEPTPSPSATTPAPTPEDPSDGTTEGPAGEPTEGPAEEPSEEPTE